MTDLVTFVRARLDARTLAMEEQNWPREHSYKRGWEERDVAAKRAIVDAYEFTAAQYEKLIAYRVGSWEAGLLSSAEDAVRHLAAIDDSHPDYDESWRP